MTKQFEQTFLRNREFTACANGISSAMTLVGFTFVSSCWWASGLFTSGALPPPEPEGVGRTGHEGGDGSADAWKNKSKRPFLFFLHRERSAPFIWHQRGQPQLLLPFTVAQTWQRTPIPIPQRLLAAFYNSSGGSNNTNGNGRGFSLSVDLGTWEGIGQPSCRTAVAVQQLVQQPGVNRLLSREIMGSLQEIFSTNQPLRC